MIIIENNAQLLSFCQTNPKVLLLIPVWSSPRAHEYNTHLSFVYIRTKDSEYIINVNHIDAGKCDAIDFNLLTDNDTLVLGSRYLNTKGVDFEWVYFESYHKPFIFNEFVESLYLGHRNDFKELNDCLPLMKWYEKLKTVPMVSDIRESDYIYSDRIKILGRLEGAGVAVDREKFIDRFKYPSQYLPTNIVHTKYNPYTTTGRPSNHHMNVNWAALNKSDGSRAVIVSRFEDGGSLIQFDYESYHIRLIGKMVGYEFPIGMTAHAHLAQYYGVSVEEAKPISFRYLYGGLDDMARNIPFFQKVDTYIKKGYQQFVTSGALTTPIHKRKIDFKRIDTPTEQKVFNYLLQALETEINYMRIRDILDWLERKQSKLILYTYDAFVIDTHPSERDELLNVLKPMLESGNFPVKTYEGMNYDSLIVIR